MTTETESQLRPGGALKWPDRNTITISHLDPVLWEWCKEEAARLSKTAGGTIRAWQVLELAVQDYHDRKEAANASTLSRSL